VEARLLWLEVEGFRSFKRKVRFNFPDGDAVILINGRWVNSSTRSGSGKTSIIEAIAYLLDLTDASQASLKNWDSKKMIVRGGFRIGTSTVQVTRDPKLSLIIDNEPYNSLTKGASAKLEELLGGNAEILKSITYRKQRKPGKIINATDSKIKEFLTEPLKLGPVEAAAEQLTQQVTKLTQEIELLKRDEATLSGFVASGGVSEEEASRARTAYDQAKAQYEAIASQANVSQQLMADSQRLSEEIRAVNSLISQVNLKKAENQRIKISVVDLNAEIETLKRSSCPTCRREWDQAQDLLNQKNAQVDQLIFQLRSNIEYIGNSEPMIANLPNLQAMLQDVQRKIGEMSAPMSMAQQTLSAATSALNSLQYRQRTFLEQSGKLEQVRSKIVTSQRELLIAETSSKLIGRSGFLGSIFDEILADIEVRTNDMLQHFPNAEQFTVQVSSTKLVKTKGTTKKEISVTISRAGTDVGYDDLSGGQQSAIELCTDLAYAEAVRARSGCAPRWTCLDEVMDGLGSSEKAAVVEMIRKRIKGLVLMIEHATEIKESFDQTINIEYDGRESYVASL
jgi:DNA repair exonuclease SbcCD ATPase subunit